MQSFPGLFAESMKAMNAVALNEAYAGQTGEGIRLANLVLDI
ncbi:MULTISPECIES: hypothetical protein [Prosthecochloris]|nr:MULTISPECIES: hypothetical protein [Prosthecochloris]UZJ36995.1 hypothetical protein OO005_09565 [Prosthecochloris sp. SCSIO W1103]